MQEKEEIFAYLLGTSSRLFKRLVNHQLDSFGLTTSQCGVLRMLYHKEESTQAEIADTLKADRATTGTIIQKLLEKGYLIRQVSPVDSRAYIVRLSEQAHAMVSEIERISAETAEQVLSGFEKEEREGLYRALSKIISNLDGLLTEEEH